MTDLDARHPEFTVAIRGYDRLAVDEYIARLQQMVGEAEERARVAESGAHLGGHATISPRVAEIFELAGAEARELREKVEREAKHRLSEARKDAKEIIAAAHSEAQQVSDRAAREREALLEEDELERERIRIQVTDLEQRRSAVIQELTRLHDALGIAAGIASPPSGKGKAKPAQETTPSEEQAHTDKTAPSEETTVQLRSAG